MSKVLFQKAFVNERKKYLWKLINLKPIRILIERILSRNGSDYELVSLMHIQAQTRDVDQKLKVLDGKGLGWWCQ